MPSTSQPPGAEPRRTTDILRWPGIGPLLRWRHVRTAGQVVLLLVAAVVVLHGLAGPQIAAYNLATVLTWIYYRGLLIAVLLLAANLFCAACPMILVRDVARRLHAPARAWPRWLGRKHVAIASFAGILFVYELFDLWAFPDATAWLVIGYFAAAVAVDVTFRGAAFCKHVCPVGQFNFVASTLSPLEVRTRDKAVCQSCTTVDCIKGRRDPVQPLLVLQRGCELALFQPTKIGNLDCTFCLDCVQACPHDNVAIGTRVPGDELADDRRRSSLGRLSRRPDLAALALVFTFGALLNAFAMTGPVYAVEAWLAAALGTTREAPALAIVFAAAMAVVPVILCAAAAAVTRRVAPVEMPLTDVAIRFAYALVPLGAGVWLAHYAFHFLTALGTILPISQAAVAEFAGGPWLGEPNWGWLGVRPGAVFPLQIGSTLLGGLGSIGLVHRIAARDHAGRAAAAALPWAALVCGLAALAIWILAQPMEMRASGLGG